MNSIEYIRIQRANECGRPWSGSLETLSTSNHRRDMKILIIKVAIAATAITSVVVIAASQVLPGVQTWKVVLGAAALAAGLFAVAVISIYAAGSVKELLLRWGAIDTQWLWFGDNPKGFNKVWRNGSTGAAVQRPTVPPRCE